MNHPTLNPTTSKPWLASLLRRRSLTTLALLLALGRAPTPAHATTITVANGEVAINANGRCSLREALANANNTTTGVAHNDCAPGNPAGADIIQLPHNGRFALTTAYSDLDASTGLPPITTNITITGNGATITRAANAPPFRLLAVGPTGRLTLDSLTLQGGESANGAAIFNQGTVTITNSLLSGHTAERGGAIFNDYSSLTITNSTLSDNAADEGGAIYSSGGRLTLHQTTLNANSATIRGGGLFVASDQVMLSNSTISGNTADFRGGGLYNRGILNLTNATLTNNTATLQEGGGLFNDGTAILVSSILSGNTAAFAPELYNSYAGRIIANSYNLIGHSDESGSNFQPGSVDLIPAEATDAILDPALANHGGPTATHALPPNSPALDHAPSEACGFSPINGRDQRHAPRNIDADATPTLNECDAGAFEQQAAVRQLFLPSVLSQLPARR